MKTKMKLKIIFLLQSMPTGEVEVVIEDILNVASSKRKFTNNEVI